MALVTSSLTISSAVKITSSSPQEVSWSAFTDGRNTLFYMDGPDLIAQRPILYVDPVNNHIIREDKGGQAQSEFGAIMRPLTARYRCKI